ncbi:MAG: hypothetical protein K2K60_01470 [Clostridia bacterium]|nr:hypothetical protein [Clostridia bacterium]
MSKKAFRGLIAIVVVIVLLAAAWFAGWKITGQINPVKWGKKSADASDTVVAIDGEGNELIEGEMYALPRSMAFMRSAADSSNSQSSVTVSAKLNSDYADYIEGLSYKWGGNWADSSAEWADGKNIEDYINIIETAESDTVKVQCKQAFGEPIILTATLENAPTQISGTCQVDYIRRVQFNGSAGFSDIDEPIDAFVESRVCLGTVTGSVAFNSITVRLTDEFKTAVSDMLKFSVNFKDYSFSASDDKEYIDLNIWFNLPTIGGPHFIEEAEIGHHFTPQGVLSLGSFVSANGLSGLQRKAFAYAWYNAYHLVNSLSGASVGGGDYTNALMSLEFEYCYNGVLVQTFGVSDYGVSIPGNSYANLVPNDLVMSGGVQL